MLCLVVDQQSCNHHSIEYIVQAAVEAGAKMIQLREKRADTKTILGLGKRLQTILRPLTIPLIINDRVDIAMALDADGVHLGQADMFYLAARRLLGAAKIMGLTIETPEQALIANQWDVDYIGVGPIFSTITKLDAPHPIGVEGLAAISKISRHKIIAIGGISNSNIQLLSTTKLYGIAVVSAICGAENPQQISADLIESFREKVS